MNIGILLYFKYFNFFMDNFNLIFESIGWNPLVFTRVLLPLGVSFVVFQKMTYCLDIARGTTKPAENFFQLVEYLLIFPQIIAGPIVKYNEIADQIKERTITKEMFQEGFQRFAIGLFKKVWIADIVARIADTVFGAFSLGSIPFDYAWVGILAYSFQIYFDFSAYSDMAIGMLSMMGFRIQENFNMPYTALSVTDFWKRWHISMTSWFREYLYFPLGGNRKGTVRTYINQWIVFLVSGFWHGASWNFVFWGAYHGSLLCAERAFFLKRTQHINRLIRVVLTFFLVMIGWVFFRADSIGMGFAYIGSMFNFSNYNVHVNPAFILVVDLRTWLTLVLAALICFVPLLKKPYQWLKTQIAAHTVLRDAGVLTLFLISALKVITGSNSPFIYFRF
jgi:alginate O-acetyltransferase complex protein AlgI